MRPQPFRLLDPLQIAARIGFAARGLVYLLVGWLALAAAVADTRPRGGAEVFGGLVDEATGRLLVAAIAIGLSCYGSWRLLAALVRLRSEGENTPSARLGRAADGVLHLMLAGYAAALSVGLMALEGTTEFGGSSLVQDWTAWLLRLPFGRWVLGGIGAAISWWGVGQLGHARRGDLRDELRASDRVIRVVEPIGRVGFVARGVVFVLVGLFFIVSAWHLDATRSGGLGFALRALQAQTAGPWLLGLVAAGLVLFGVYGLVEAAYRRVEAQLVVSARLSDLAARIRRRLTALGRRA